MQRPPPEAAELTFTLLGQLREEPARPSEIGAVRPRPDEREVDAVPRQPRRKAAILGRVLFGREVSAAAPRLVADTPEAHVETDHDRRPARADRPASSCPPGRCSTRPIGRSLVPAGCGDSPPGTARRRTAGRTARSRSCRTGWDRTCPGRRAAPSCRSPRSSSAVAAIREARRHHASRSCRRSIPPAIGSRPGADDACDRPASCGCR